MNSAISPVREVRVGPDQDGQRLDNFLARQLGAVPRSLVYRLIRTGQVRVNGGRVKPMRKLVAGDRVRVPPVRKPDDDSNRGAAAVPDARVDEIRGRILHRQDEFVVIDKPAGMAAQAGSGLAWGLNDVVARIEPRALPVHRLDRETSGLMLFALGAVHARQLQQLFRTNQIEKRYLALLDGHLNEDRVDVDQALLKIRDTSGQHRVVVDPDGKPARSSLRRLERLPRHEFVEVRIETGRTHQIRAHAKFLGTPLVGDDRYNSNPPPPGLNRLFLHAAWLRLPWPEDQVFSAALPEQLTETLDRLRG
ncbi:MAG: RluA family pseudouridine synthase [Wenzhouxiangellaceae bacterium]